MRTPIDPYNTQDLGTLSPSRTLEQLERNQPSSHHIGCRLAWTATVTHQFPCPFSWQYQSNCIPLPCQCWLHHNGQHTGFSTPSSGNHRGPIHLTFWRSNGSRTSFISS